MKNFFYNKTNDRKGMSTAKKVGNNLKDARKAKGLTQKEVAVLLRMTQQQYSRFENGIFELNYEQILKLCVIFDVTPNDLFLDCLTSGSERPLT